MAAHDKCIMIRDAHGSFGKSIDSLNALVIGAQRSSMMLARSMLMMTGVRSVATFENPVQALNYMISYAIDLVLIDAECQPISGLKFVKVIRHRTAEPLCFVPVVLTCAQPTPNYVTQAVKAGAHLVLNRPYSTSMLRDRLLWLLADKRKMYLEGNSWKIEGADQLLQHNAQGRLLPSLVSQLGLGVPNALNDGGAAQALIDNVLGSEAEAEAKNKAV